MFLMEMVGKTKFILVVALFFIESLGQNEDGNEEAIELEVELDTKEENKVIQAMDNTDTQTLDHNVANEEMQEVADDSEINDEAADDVSNNKLTASQTDNKDETPNNLQDLKHEKTSDENTPKKDNALKVQPKPLWKIKDIADETREAGFDLTDVEQKKFKIWKDGVIPYYIDVVSFSDKVLRDKIRNYLQMVNSATGVKFIELSTPPSDDNERWVLFMNRRGLLCCADHSVKDFSNQGVQQVVLGYDCMETRGELAEAVMSILGVPAQHNAPDRDQYITVNMDNIMPDKKHLFEKLNDNEWLFHDLEYDYNSITHYDMFKYSANGRASIQIKNDAKDFNPAKTMSADDILKIKMLYNFITRNAQMHEPTCEKLFKPRNEHERFIPSKGLKKSREIPARYLSNKYSGRMSLKESEAFRERYLQQLIENAEKTKKKNKQTTTAKPSVEIVEIKRGESDEERLIKNTDAMAMLSDYRSD